MFAHLADLHLDAHAAQIKKKDPVTNRPMRELDMEHAFELAVDDIISNAEDVDCCVIAGDIFDSYHATADSAIVAINQIRRITEAGIHVVAIAGNHDTPTNVRKTPKFLELAAALGDNDLVTMSYDDVKHVVIGDTEYVLLPHLVCLGGLFTEADLTPTSDARHAVLVVHGVAAGDPSLKQQDEMREIPIAKWIMDMPWDYVAFGHYHMPGWVPGYVGKAAYSGSLENTVISGPDVCMHRGPVYVDLDADDELVRVRAPEEFEELAVAEAYFDDHLARGRERRPVYREAAVLCDDHLVKVPPHCGHRLFLLSESPALLRARTIFQAEAPRRAPSRKGRARRELRARVRGRYPRSQPSSC